MNRRNSLITGSAIAASSLIGLLTLSGCDSASGPTSVATRNGLKPGLQAPIIAGPDLEGNQMSLAEFKGKVVVLEFWSPT
ncbi:redoxin domain-containing protein [bacterium]|nr:redoxin domain-containing protein [bacterium]